MDTRRLFLFMALTFTGVSLWNAWQADYPAQKPSKSNITTKVTSGSGVPVVTSQNTPVVQAVSTTSEPSPIIQVKTDVLDLNISLQHGDIIKALLLKYPQNSDDPDKPFVLLDNSPQLQYIAKSNLVVSQNNKVEPLALDFKSEFSNYDMQQDQEKLIISLQGQTEDGLQVSKEFILTRGSYLIDVQYKIKNNADATWQGFFNTQLMQTSPKEDKSSIFHVGSFTGASYSNPGKTKYQKIGFSDMAKAHLELESSGGWIAMQQHYFLTAWVPQPDTNNTFYTRAAHDEYIIGAVSRPLDVAPQSETAIGSRLYLGPENTEVLQSIAPSLDLTVDYGILWFLSSILFSIMRAIHNLVGNWGWSIVLVTVLVKLAFYRLSATSYKSMAGMRKLQPKLQALKERYGDDKAKISQATMELYRQEKVNPLGGCLPIVIQIPVFIALYWVLLESVELRQAPFVFWIRDLASADPYHVLPLIMGATMMVQQKLNPAPPDPAQAKVMMFLPLLFTALFWNFPSGLVLYWIVNNTLSIVQQWYITRKYSDDKPVKKQPVPAK